MTKQANLGYFFTPVPSGIWVRTDLPPAAKVVLGALIEAMRQHGYCYLSRADVGQISDLGHSYASEMVSLLIEKGIIATKRGKTVNKFWLDPAWVEQIRKDDSDRYSGQSSPATVTAPPSSLTAIAEHTDRSPATKIPPHQSSQISQSDQDDACLPAGDDAGGGDAGPQEMDPLARGLQKYHVDRATARQWATAQPTAVAAWLFLLAQYRGLVAEGYASSPIKNVGGFLRHALEVGNVPDDDLWALEWEGSEAGLVYFLQCLSVSYKKKTDKVMLLPQPWDLPAVRAVLQSFIGNGWGKEKLSPLTWVVWQLGGSTAARKVGQATAIARAWGQLQPLFKDWLAAEGDKDRREDLLSTVIDFPDPADDDD
jgi:hypothetical protein